MYVYRYSLLFLLLMSLSCIESWHFERNRLYVDDFESSKLADPVSSSADKWFRASPPFSTGDSLYYCPRAWDFYWFSPTIRDEVHKVLKDEVIKLTETERKMNTTGTNYIGVLRLHATPAPPADSLEGRFKRAWAGIMHPISQSSANKEQMQYFEFFVKAEGGFERKGNLKFQMGLMREDISLDGKPPNGKADREDTAQIVPTRRYDNNLDLGWDKLKDEDEVYYIPSNSEGEWDSILYGDPLLGIDSFDPARDNYKEYRNDEDSDPANYRYACKEQGDGHIEYSEDINSDGTVETDIDEQYFQFTIDLADSNSPFIDKTINYTHPGTWRKYRIPLHELVSGYEDSYTTVNNPTWSNVTMLRVIWTDFDSLLLQRESKLILYNMEFVVNQWQEVSGANRTMIRSSVVNTKENRDYEEYIMKYNDRIEREKDEYGYLTEQSLRLNFINLVDGDTALVEKDTRDEPVSISHSKSLTLLVFGWYPEGSEPPTNVPLYSGDIRFVFRFGKDDESYYEYSRPVYPEWRNEIIIDVEALADLEDDARKESDDAGIDIHLKYNDNNDEQLGIHASKGKLPDIGNITWMAMGVARDGNKSGEESLSGEIWVNEMKRVPNE